MPSIEFQLTSYAPGHAMPPHIDACRRVSIVLAGTLVEFHARRNNACAPGSVAIKAADLVHHDRYGPDGTEILSVILPDPLLDALDLASRWRRWEWLHEGPPRRAALRLAAAAMRRDGIAIAGALGELADHLREQPSSNRLATPARAHLDAIRALLHADPEHELPVTQLAREAGLHPVTVGQQFRRAYGCSIRAYRQRLRGEQVAVALMAPRPSLTSIALAHGFFDLSHLTRVFRREYGVPPGAFRKTLSLGERSLQSCKTSWVVPI